MAKPYLPSQRNRRRLKVSEFYLEGKTQSEIAARLKVDQGTISRDLKVLQRSWQIRANNHINKVKARELARIDKLERTYWIAWRKSTRKRKEITIENPTEHGDSDKFKFAEKVKSWRETGEYKYLEGIQWCIEQRMKIFGFVAATKLRYVDEND